MVQIGGLSLWLMDVFDSFVKYTSSEFSTNEHLDTKRHHCDDFLDFRPEYDTFKVCSAIVTGNFSPFHASPMQNLPFLRTGGVWRTGVSFTYYAE